MARPPKSHLQLITEGKSHRTKAELETRAKAEKALLTGSSMREWPEVKANPTAHKEFARIRKLLKSIQHDDALHEAVINRYCLLIAECDEFDRMKARLIDDLETLCKHHAQGDIGFMEYMDLKGKLQDRIMACDRKIMDKRKMLLSIEKENIMTIASALRAIPKQPSKQEKTGMAAFLERRQAGKNGT